MHRTSFHLLSVPCALVTRNRGTGGIRAVLRRASIGVTVVLSWTMVTASTALATPGNLDPTFGEGGWALVRSDQPPDAYATSLATRPDGRIVVAGRLGDAFAMWGYRSDGTPDASFGTDGTVVPTVGGRVSGALKILLQPDGRIIALGFAGHHAVAVQLTAGGSPDLSFGGGDGIVRVPFGEGIWSTVRDGALLSDGGILLGGLAGPKGVVPQTFLARLQSDGTLDAAFGSGGIVTDPRWFEALTSDDRGIVVALRPRSPFRFTVARYDLQGAPDPTFGGDGARRYCVFEDACDGYDFYGVQDVVEDAGGRLVLVFGGYFPQGETVNGWGAIRLTPDGARDETFSGDGLVTLFGTSLGDSPTVLAMHGDGTIVLGGYVGAGGGSGEVYPAIVKLEVDGTLDTTFGDQGVVVAPPEPGFWSYGVDLSIQPDGKLILLADVSYPEEEDGYDFGLARFLAA